MEKYQKQCQKCGRVLPETMFHRKNKSADGLQDWCKECKKENSRRNYKRNQVLKNKIKTELEVKIKNKLEGKLRKELKEEIKDEMRTKLRAKKRVVTQKQYSLFGKIFKLFKRKRNNEFKIPLNNVISIEHKKDKLVVIYKK